LPNLRGSARWSSQPWLARTFRTSVVSVAAAGGRDAACRGDAGGAAQPASGSDHHGSHTISPVRFNSLSKMNHSQIAGALTRSIQSNSGSVYRHVASGKHVDEIKKFRDRVPKVIARALKQVGARKKRKAREGDIRRKENEVEKKRKQTKKYSHPCQLVSETKICFEIEHAEGGWRRT
jgi:hypothetical protein